MDHTVSGVFIKVRNDFGDQNKLSFESLYFFVVPFSFLLKGDYNEMLDNRRVLRLGYE